MEELYKIVQNEGITLDYGDLAPFGRGLYGLYVLDPMLGHYILLDKRLLSRPREHRCVLAEEIGHALHPPRLLGHVRFCRRRYESADNDAIIVAQDEQKALRWATDFLIPDVEIWRVVKKDGINTVPELAEHFYVTEWFIRAKIGFIRRQARDLGGKLKWSDIIKRAI